MEIGIGQDYRPYNLFFERSSHNSAGWKRRSVDVKVMCRRKIQHNFGKKSEYLTVGLGTNYGWGWTN